MSESAPTFYEFFAGGGMARAGLGDGWRCLFANDFDPMKAATYAANWGRDHLLCRDVGKVTTADLPGVANLVWASFPCQDLSLAGDCAGLGRASSRVATRSGTFWPFWALIKSLKRERRAPSVVVLENVYGALTSRGGKDFAAIGAAFSASGYKFGAVVIDAIHFLPQSRPRVFFVAVQSNVVIPYDLRDKGPSPVWHPRTLLDAHRGLPQSACRNWIWWKLAAPPVRTLVLSSLIEDKPSGVRWHTESETAALLAMMSNINRAKVELASKSGRKMIGGLYKRTRPNERGEKVQRAEVRFDDIAGCLRTPAGGSSRQLILTVEGDCVRSRLLSPREAARLMGLDDGYKLPMRYNDAYHVAGDGVCPPVVRHLAGYLLEPLLASCQPPLLRLMAAA